MPTTPHEIRIHYIPEWAQRLGIERAEIIEKTGADKGLVSRWFSGTVPTDRYLVMLAEIFGFEDVTDVSGLFRDPEDDWIARWFRKRKSEELQRLYRLMIEMDSGVAAFRRDPAPPAAVPKRRKTNAA